MAKAAEAAYLGYLAWQALKPGGRGMFETTEIKGGSWAKLFRMGLATNLVNPQVAIMYLALIPQFIDPHRGHLAAQGFTLGGVQILVSLVMNALTVVGAGVIAGFVARRPTWATWQRRVTGTMLGCVAVLLAREVPARARI